MARKIRIGQADFRADQFSSARPIGWPGRAMPSYVRFGWWGGRPPMAS